MGLYRTVTTIHHPALGGIGTNTWHIRTVGVGPDINTTLGAMMEGVREFFRLSSPIFPVGTEIRFNGEASGVGPDEGEFAQIDPWTNTQASTATSLPPATALCVNWFGQSGDRSRRGRTFVGPIATSALQDDGTPDSTALANVRSQAAALVEVSDTFSNGALGVWSRQEGVFRDFVGSSVTDKFAVLRSRRD